MTAIIGDPPEDAKPRLSVAEQSALTRECCSPKSTVGRSIGDEKKISILLRPESVRRKVGELVRRIATSPSSFSASIHSKSGLAARPALERSFEAALLPVQRGFIKSEEDVPGRVGKEVIGKQLPPRRSRSLGVGNGP